MSKYENIKIGNVPSMRRKYEKGQKGRRSGHK